jgi:hypothetical protein
MLKIKIPFVRMKGDAEALEKALKPRTHGRQGFHVIIRSDD